MNESDEVMPRLLAAVQRRFYAGRGEREFYRDRRMLVYALAWPAQWLEERGLTCSGERYAALVTERLVAIAGHGDPEKYGAYFPAYLLKCLQDWFRHHGEDLYDELKHIRNAIDVVLRSPGLTAAVREDGRQLAVLASAHRLICVTRRREKPVAGQLRLF